MRIAYLSLHWPRPITSGVGKKLLEQMKFWREQGHDVCFFSHRHEYPDPSELIPGVSVEYRRQSGRTGVLSIELARSQALQKILAEIERYRPDLIYLRSAIYIFPLQRLFKIAPVVVEINTNEDAQHQLLGRVYHTYYQLTRRILLGGASGFVPISREIGVTGGLARYGKPTRVIPNGFDFSSVDPFPAPSNPVPRLAFIGSPGNPWHAVEKLVPLAQNCPDIHIDVIGYDHLDTAGPLPANLQLHGYLHAADYRRVLAQAEAAVGSLGLHRIRMNEGSPLKTRECLACGLPLILPFLDTDLDDLDAGWLLRIPNREDNVRSSIPAIRDFLYRVRGVRADRALLAPRLDARLKETERLQFFQVVLENTA